MSRGPSEGRPALLPYARGNLLQKVVSEGQMRLLSLLFAAGMTVSCSRSDPPADAPPQPSWELGADKWPTTCDSAADDIVAFLKPAAREELRRVRATDLISLHHGLGMTVRNRQGFWRGNRALVESCTGSATSHPDDASFEVVKRTWARVQTGP
jgi:hypothetical protein